MSKKYLVVIGGPTASGKTEVAISLAKHFKTHILSADSRQFYKEMNIGTAKPSSSELVQAPHHFIDSLSIDQPYSVGDFEREAILLLEQLFLTQDLVVMAGGSGLFIRAICEGLDHFPEVSDEVLASLNLEFKEKGIAFLQDELQQSDPDYFNEVDINNPQRLIRALSVIRSSGRPFSSFRKNEKTNRSFEPIFILLDIEREQLYERINKRVDLMIQRGLLEEAQGLFPKKELNALQTVGYQELFDHFEGITTIEEAIELIKRNSRRYAKRQMTWFRKREHWHSFHPDEKDKIIDFVNASRKLD